MSETEKAERLYARKLALMVELERANAHFKRLHALSHPGKALEVARKRRSRLLSQLASVESRITAAARAFERKVRRGFR